MPIIQHMPKMSDRLKQIQNNIVSACQRANREVSEVKLIVVTKTVSAEDIKEVIKNGFVDLGENRVQHFKQAADEIKHFLNEQDGADGLPETVNWHMIGHLQRNKVKQILKVASLIHSVDTLRLAEEIDTVAGKMGIKSDVLLQLNCSGEPQKYGAPVGAAIHLADQIATLSHVRLRGLMTMAPLTKDKDVVRACFVRARELFEDIRTESVIGRDFVHLSMGMSQDYEIAVEEGATMLRIGSAVFA